MSLTDCMYDKDGNGCFIRSLWCDSTNCFLLKFAPFLVIDSSLYMCYFHSFLAHPLPSFSYSVFPTYSIFPPILLCSYRSTYFTFSPPSPTSSLPHWPGSLCSHGADPQPVCMSVCAPVHGQISLSSELQPGSLPPDADESSSDMLVIVDEPVTSAPQSRATNSPASVSGSVSDNMNGERG